MASVYLDFFKSLLACLIGFSVFLCAPPATLFMLKWYEDTSHYIVTDGIKVYAISDRIELFLWGLLLWAVIVLLAVALYVGISLQKHRHKPIYAVIQIAAICIACGLTLYLLSLILITGQGFIGESLVMVAGSVISIIGGLIGIGAVRTMMGRTRGKNTPGQGL